VKEVVQNEMFHAKEKKISISITSTKAPKAIGNNQKIKEVITNLVNNAIKYTPTDGTVKIIFNIDNNHLVTSIADSGIGISEENQKQLFKKFFRVKNKETVGISGTGLGLFIAKQIVEKCGGEIWATSKESKGSTFSFSLKTTK
jgi:two-component system sensor histidine kinase VicK